MEINIRRDYLEIDGQPRFIYGGDLNYCRMRRRAWRDRIRKMRAAGMNTVTFYCTWLYHEPREGEWDFSGDLDLGAFMDAIHAEGMFSVPRIGPFVHGEMRNGGLPQWLFDKLGNKVRTNDPSYLELSGKWCDKVLEIVAPRLITRGGRAILIQLENELGSAGSKGDDVHRGSEESEERGAHIMFYNAFLKKYNIDIPVIDINKPYPGKEDLPLVDTGGAYPVNCFGSDGEMWPVSLNWWREHKRPKISIETTGGMFVRYYDWPAYKNSGTFQGPIVRHEIIESTMLSHLAEGYNGVNLFVFTDSEYPDGTAERMLPQKTYNFQAPLTVAGNLRESYKVVKRLGWFLRSFEREFVTSQPHESWAKAISCGIPHPGVDTGNNDLFEGYHKEADKTEGENPFRHMRKVAAHGRVNKGLNLSESNFLIMLNTRNHGASWLRDIRVETNPRGIPCEVQQEYPKRAQMELAPQENKIMPFFVKLAPRHFLEYSTATLLDRRPFGNGVQVILHARADATVETRLIMPARCPHRSRNGSLVNWESPCAASIIGVPSNGMEIVTFDSEVPLRYVLMSTERAGEVWDVASPAGDLVASSNLRIVESAVKGRKTVARLQAAERDFTLHLLAPSKPSLKGRLAQLTEEYDPTFGSYKATGSIDMRTPEIVFRKRHEGTTVIWEADVAPEMIDDAHADLCLLARHDGGVSYAYLNGQLIGDHAYGRFVDWEIHLKDHLVRAGTLRLVFEDAHRVEVEARPIVELGVEIEWE